MVLDELARRWGAKLKRHRSGCLIAEVNVAGDSVTLARPTTYMNESGQPAGALLRWYKAGPEDVIVVYDELDIPFGRVRVKEGGGAAGHNGVRSMVSHIGSGFVRVRCGIGRPRGRTEAVDHVLERFTSEERKELPFLIGAGADAVELIVTAGPERAMNEINIS
jgi:PTH1 family peptidyl-tRNA hydrolase